MEILHDFCFGWERSGGCSRNFMEVNVLSVGCELDFLSTDSDNCWCPPTSQAQNFPENMEKCCRKSDIPWRTRSYRREDPEGFEPLSMCGCQAERVRLPLVPYFAVSWLKLSRWEAWRAFLSKGTCACEGDGVLLCKSRSKLPALGRVKMARSGNVKAELPS